MKSVNKISNIQAISAPLNEVTFLDKKVKQQIDFINQCIHSGATMATALKSAGKSYDDLFTRTIIDKSFATIATSHLKTLRNGLTIFR